MCLAQGPQCSDPGEARTRSPSVSCQALYNLATALSRFCKCKICHFIWQMLTLKSQITHNWPHTRQFVQQCTSQVQNPLSPFRKQVRKSLAMYDLCLTENVSFSKSIYFLIIISHLYFILGLLALHTKCLLPIDFR